MAKSRTTWKRGQSGNPKGRPKGSKDALNELAIQYIYADWRKGGKEAIEKTREERPAEYLRAIVSMLPRDANVKVKNDLSDGFLTALMDINRAPKLEAEITRLEQENAELRGQPTPQEQTTTEKVVH